MTLLQYAKRVIARPQAVAIHGFMDCHVASLLAVTGWREAAGRGNPWIDGLPRRFAPRSDASKECFVYVIGTSQCAGVRHYA